MTQERLFTVDEASVFVSWLESKFTELDPYRAENERCQRRAEDLLQKGRSNGHGDVDEELHRMLQMAQELQKSIQDILSQITDKGIIVRDMARGLVDFPSHREGRTVHLCWHRGETGIGFWHEVDAGFAGRQPL